MIIGVIKLKRVRELIGLRCLYCSRHSLKVSKAKLYCHFTEMVVCRKSKPDSAAVLLLFCRIQYLIQYKRAMAKKVVVFCRNQMKLLVFISLVKTFIVDKALMSLFCHLMH